MEKINVTNELFNSEVEIPDIHVKLGTRGPVKFGLYTKRKPVRATDKNATMNLCAFLLHMLYIGDWKLKGNYLGDTFTMVWRTKAGTTVVVKKNESVYDVSLSEDKKNNAFIINAVILCDICQDTEFADIFNFGTFVPDLEMYYLWSDMYYFKYIAGTKKEVNVHNLTLDEIPFEEIKESDKYEWFKPILMNNVNGFKEELYTIKSEDDEVPHVEKKPRKTEKAEVYSKMRAGDYRLTYDWKSETMNSIMNLESLDRFVPVPKFYRICQKINFRMNKIMERLDQGYTGIEAIGNDVININLIGRPGTGKSTLGEALSAVFGMPVGIVKNSDDTDSDEYEGRTCIIDGMPTFTYTDFATIFENGGIILNEEVNLTPQGVTMGALGQAVIAPYTLKVNGYKNVQRHPLCIIINLFNVGTVASKQLSQPFIGRFPNTYLLDDPSEEDMIKIMLSFGCKGVNRSIAKKVYMAYTRTLAYLRSPQVNDEDIALAVSMRHCIAACQDIEEGCSLADALDETIVGVIAAYDLGIAKQVKENVINTLPGI